MIIEYEPNGCITHVVNDPVYFGLVEQLTQSGATFLDVSPTEVATGEVGEDGQPVFEAVYAECDIFKHYIVDGAIAERPTIDLPAEHAMSVGEAVTITDLPTPCTVTIDGDSFEVADGELTLDADMPAEYGVLIEAWPHIPAFIKVTIDAV